MLTRRAVLLRLAALAGGTFFGAERFLRAATAGGTSAGAREALHLGPEDRRLLNELGETILPATDECPGARAADVAAFMEEIVREFYDARERGVFLDGLGQIRRAVQAQHAGRDFLDLTATERHAFVLGLDRTQPRPEYYAMIKQLTEWGYFTSEIGGTEALAYTPIPGMFSGCVPAEPGARAALW